jgi:hypothetical protein
VAVAVVVVTTLELKAAQQQQVVEQVVVQQLPLELLELHKLAVAVVEQPLKATAAQVEQELWFYASLELTQRQRQQDHQPEQYLVVTLIIIGQEMGALHSNGTLCKIRR